VIKISELTMAHGGMDHGGMDSPAMCNMNVHKVLLNGLYNYS